MMKIDVENSKPTTFWKSTFPVSELPRTGRPNHGGAWSVWVHSLVLGVALMLATPNTLANNLKVDLNPLSECVELGHL